MNKPLILKILFAILIFVLFCVPLGPLASFGQLLNPYSGVWKMTHNDFENLPKNMKLKLKNNVRVEFEASGIPHVFAENDEDLYFVQGYLQARDRLWEMDFFSRVASGRLSEVFGSKTLPIDETFVQLRIPEAAEASQKVMMADPLTKLAIENFADGVNFFITHLPESDMPLEFKLFRYRPEAWSPFKTALLAKFMAFNLAGSSKDLTLTRSHLLFSEGDFKELFPDEFEYKESVISGDHKWNFINRAPAPPKDHFQAKLQSQKLKVEPHPGNGSNNWAVFGSKSSTGFPIVSNDIHLDYSLPALWYQMQLKSKNQNVYGVSLVGAPGIIIGFSKDFAWAVTNASGDFMDWYEMKYRDSSHHEYLFDKVWRRVEEHEHTIYIKDQTPHKLTLRSTHFGPIVFDDDEPPGLTSTPHGLALRWTALSSSNDLRALLNLNRSHNLNDCQAALVGFSAPAQNFICADSKGDVRIGQQGEFPLRFKNQGRMVADGSDPRYQSSGTLNQNELAFEINPPRNFVFSANQKPTGPSYPSYLGQYYEPAFRAQRIHQLLSEKATWTPEEIIDMQRDSFNKLAEKAVPTLVAELRKIQLSILEAKSTDELEKWNFKNEAQSVAATIFEYLWRHLEANIWGHYFPDKLNYALPSPFTTSELIKNDLHSKWLNPENESFQGILHQSLKESLSDLEKTYGPDISQWQWHNESRAILPHLTKLPFLLTSVDSGGNRFNIFANRNNHGPVWKMVVSLGPEPKAWGVYPGGQSADIRSPHAKEFLNDWAQGHLRPLLFLDEPTAQAFKAVLFETEPMK